MAGRVRWRGWRGSRWGGEASERREGRAAAWKVPAETRRVSIPGAGSRRLVSEQRENARHLEFPLCGCLGLQGLTFKVEHLLFDVVRIPEPTICSQEHLIKWESGVHL